jgi:hypothetical protein
MMSWFVSLVTNWFSNSWRLLKGAYSFLGQVGMDDEEFLTMEWHSPFQREIINSDQTDIHPNTNPWMDADCVSQGPFDSKYY